jgi:hypothetical protein
MGRDDETRIIPGIRQDHEGKLYRIKQHGQNKGYQQEHVPATIPPLDAATQAGLKPVLVESTSRPGIGYQSLACFQGRGA